MAAPDMRSCTESTAPLWRAEAPLPAGSSELLPGLGCPPAISPLAGDSGVPGRLSRLQPLRAPGGVVGDALGQRRQLTRAWRSGTRLLCVFCRLGLLIRAVVRAVGVGARVLRF